MSLFPRRLLTSLVCCLFAGSASASLPEADVVAGLAEPDVPVPQVLETATSPDVAVSAADVPPPSEDEAPSMRLRVERKFDLLAPRPKVAATSVMFGARVAADSAAPGKEDVYPSFLMAETISGRNDEVTEAEGNAELRRPNKLLLADKITYWSMEDEVEARGHVYLKQLEDEISGPYMRMKISEQIGVFEQATYKMRKEVQSKFYRPVQAVTSAINVSTTTGGAPLMLYVPRSAGLPTNVPPRRSTDGYGYAERIDFEGENHVRLNEATYSTCQPDDTDWYIKAKEFALDYDREIGDTNDATLYFKDLPIFYTPVGSFSLNHNRKSGFLPVNFSASTKNGLDLTAPYYWNLAPNYDATFYPRYMAKRGTQLGAEAQYVDYNYRGVTKFEFMPDDQIAQRHRHGYNIMHTHNLGQGLTATLNLNGVSDDNYWQDFTSRTLQTSQVQLPRQVILGYAPGGWWSSSLQVLRYQTLQPGGTAVSRPYFIEPQLSFNGRRAARGEYDTDLTMTAQYTQFTHPTQVEGGRTVVYPQISMPYFDPGFMIIPKLGLHATQYALQHQASGVPNNPTRVLPTFTFDSTLVFERETKLLDLDYIQTLEPRLYYVYIPYRDQSKLPVFDTGLADFNFAQIFTENRYSGYDRINDANQVTAAVTSRFLDPNTGAERFKGMLGQRYYFEQQRVSLSGEVQRAKNFSNIVAAFTGTVLPKTYVDSALEYNYHQSLTQRLSAGLRYQPELAKVLSASYRYSRDPTTLVPTVDQIDIAGQWPLGRGWYAVGRYNYSMHDKQALETIGGIEYNAGCWAARGVIQRLEALGGAPNTTFFFQLELNDFASVGSNPLQLLRRTIPGYGKVNEMPTTGSLLTTQ